MAKLFLIIFSLMLTVIILIAGCTSTQSSDTIITAPTPASISAASVPSILAPVPEPTPIPTPDPIVASCQVKGPYPEGNMANLLVLPIPQEMFDFDCRGHMTRSSNVQSADSGIIPSGATSSVFALCPDGTKVPATVVKGCEQAAEKGAGQIWTGRCFDVGSRPCEFGVFSADTQGRILHASHGNPPIVTISQMPPDNPQIVYWNDTVDISLVIGGSSGIVTRVPGGECVDVSSFSHKILINPATFPAGVWYQWSSDGNYAAGSHFSGGNIPVFEVVAGTRPTVRETTK